MHVDFRCPSCDAPNRGEVASDSGEPGSVACAACDWSRAVPPDDVGSRCLVCGCDDLWRQKDFPQSIGLLFVVIGATLSTIAWAYHEPVWAIGILLGFAAMDLLLFLLVPDVLVCYRCSARYRGVARPDDPTYDHELGERYRQESIRLQQRTGPSH